MLEAAAAGVDALIVGGHGTILAGAYVWDRRWQGDVHDTAAARGVSCVL